MASFQFRPAVRSQTSLLLGLAGPSGSGKTLSALKLARGIVGGDDRRIFVIDTEAGRALHYACAAGEKPGPFRFQFQHVDLTAPFTPARYTEAITAAVAAGAGVVIVDSASHEHEGQGGILEMHEAALTRMAGNDYAKRERMTFAAWIEPKALHNRFVNTLLQQRCHLIFCFRAKDKMKLVKNERGKMEPVQLGWTAICADRMEYEMTDLLMLPPNAKGVPDLAAPGTKLQEAHRSFFPAGKPIGEEAGKMLAEWARGAAAAPPAHDADTGEIKDNSAPSGAVAVGSAAVSTAEPQAPPQAEGAGGAASECPDNLLPDGPVCPRCGGSRAPSGVDGGSWVHFPRTTAPAGEPFVGGGFDVPLQVAALWNGAEREKTVADLKAYCQINQFQLDQLKEIAPAEHAALGAKINARLRDLKARAHAE